MDKRPVILWADDEIDLLRPHIIFLESRGYSLITVNNGVDAIAKVASEPVDLVILDEHMPGISGLRTLSIIKERMPQLPVVMITKSEEEDIMDQAIGGKIADYLIKPVNPRQILSSVKKCLDASKLISETAADRYIGDFREISQAIGQCQSLTDWIDLYRRIVYWQVELSSPNPGAERSFSMMEMVDRQLEEADKVFFKFICKNYNSLLADSTVTMSPDIMKQKVFPLLDSGEAPWLILIDNFRLDQWFILRNLMTELFRIDDESLYCSILPTVTQYARNSIFSGLMPDQIKKYYSGLWVDEKEDGAKNANEEQLLRMYLERTGRKGDIFYSRVFDSDSCSSLVTHFSDIADKDLKVVVINFIDMLSHERTSSKTIRELSETDAGFRAITESWFRHSAVMELFKAIALSGRKIVITTDHGTVRVNKPVKVMADKSASDTLRYKVGKNLRFGSGDVLEVKDPGSFGLPSSHIAGQYIFAGSDAFFVYQNNYNKYIQYYGRTFQHGGISLEEMIVPLITLTPK